MKSWMATLVASALIACVSIGAFADVVIMSNGDRISGTVNRIVGGNLIVTTTYAGDVPVALGAIAQIESDAEFSMLSGDSRLKGKFVNVDGRLGLQTATGVQPLDINTVAKAQPGDLTYAALTTEWSSRADLSAILSHGNSDTESINALITSLYSRGNVEHFFSLLVSQEEAEEVTTKDQLDFDYLYKRFLSEKWYAAGNAEYFKDELKGIDSRISLGAGMGYQFWANDVSAFSMDLGVSAVYEDLDTGSESNPAVRWGLNYNRWLMKERLEFFHNQSVLFIPDSDRGEVIQSSTGLRYALNAHIDAAARVDLNHETEPTPPNSKSDVTWVLGVGIKF